MMNFANRQVAANRYLSALSHFISILSYFQVEEGCRDNFASIFLMLKDGRALQIPTSLVHQTFTLGSICPPHVKSKIKLYGHRSY